VLESAGLITSSQPAGLSRGKEGGGDGCVAPAAAAAAAAGVDEFADAVIFLSASGMLLLLLLLLLLISLMHNVLSFLTRGRSVQCMCNKSLATPAAGVRTQIPHCVMLSTRLVSGLDLACCCRNSVVHVVREVLLLGDWGGSCWVVRVGGGGVMLLLWKEGGLMGECMCVLVHMWFLYGGRKVAAAVV